MKTIDAGAFAANVNQILQDSLSELIVVTKSGKPCAIVHGLGFDDEQLAQIQSSDFWAMIAERRQRPSIPWEDAKSRLLGSD